MSIDGNPSASASSEVTSTDRLPLIPSNIRSTASGATTDARGPGGILSGVRSLFSRRGASTDRNSFSAGTSCSNVTVTLDPDVQFLEHLRCLQDPPKKLGLFKVVDSYSDPEKYEVCAKVLVDYAQGKVALHTAMRALDEATDLRYPELHTRATHTLIELLAAKRRITPDQETALSELRQRFWDCDAIRRQNGSSSRVIKALAFAPPKPATERTDWYEHFRGLPGDIRGRMMPATYQIQQFQKHSRRLRDLVNDLRAIGVIDDARCEEMNSSLRTYLEDIDPTPEGLTKMIEECHRLFQTSKSPTPPMASIVCDPQVSGTKCGYHAYPNRLGGVIMEKRLYEAAGYHGLSYEPGGAGKPYLLKQDGVALDPADDKYRQAVLRLREYAGIPQFKWP